jgi:anti-sigma B factor antagonist
MTKGQFQHTAATDGQPPVVTAVGDIDLANLDEFESELSEAAYDSSTITVDLSRVTYCDSAAVRALFAAAASTKLSLVIPASGTIPTVFRIAGLDKVATLITVDQG